MLEIIKEVLIYLGFTPDKVAPLLILALLCVCLINYRIKKEVSPLNKIVDKMEGFILRLCGALESNGKINKIQLYTKSSPLRLTPDGERILREIGFTKVIDEHTDLFEKTIEKFSPNSALDVENTCIGIVRFLMLDKSIKFFKEVEDYLYTHPDYNDPEIFKTAGLYLRDKYLKKHPELLPKE